MKLKLVSADKGCEIVVSGVINVLIMCELARRWLRSLVCVATGCSGTRRLARSLTVKYVMSCMQERSRNGQ